MKTILLFLFSALLVLNGHAQNPAVKVKDKANQRVNSKTDQAIDKGLDKTETAIGNIFKKKDKKAKSASADSAKAANNPVNTNNSGAVSTNQTTGSGTQVNSFSDFVAGENVLFFDDFKQDALSDFPAKWNTNGSGKIVTIDGQQGKWLDITHNSIVNPVLDKALPENCTVEFDLFLQVSGDRLTPFIEFGLTPVKDVMREDLFYKDKFFVSINRYNENDGRQLDYGLKEVVGNKNDFALPSYANKVLHVSMAVNKTRVRVYFDKSKLIDLPRALTPELRNNFYFCNMYMVPASDIGVLVSNLRIASAETDARSLLIKQLMEEGRAVTNDILFDVNSDMIKKESYNIVNQFGEALKTNAGLNIKITGHTDSDGTPAGNMELSKKRAAAVKAYLVMNYSIDDSRIQTDGKGASMPVSNNSSAEGKAKNRRVEFVKL
jgi:outer membrane protein OmpA-like peptidoglycan-associated protein